MKRKFGKMSMIMLASTLLAGAAPAENVFAEVHYNLNTERDYYYSLGHDAEEAGDRNCANICGYLRYMLEMQSQVLWAQEENNVAYMAELEEEIAYGWHLITEALEQGIADGHIKLEDGYLTCVVNDLDFGTYDAPEADAVIAKISAIGTVTYTEACKDKIDQARSDYDALTSIEKTLITNYEDLTAAERAYEALKAEAEAVIDKINAIGTVAYTDECKDLIDEARRAYNALTSDQTTLVTNYASLTAAEREYEALKAEADAAAAEAVIDKINAIGTVAYTDECKDLIDEARRAYDALTSDQTTLVTNYAGLTAAERAYEALKAEVNAAAAAAVIDKINDIGTVTYTDECRTRIEEARRAYDALTGDQQALVTNDEGLTAAEREYAALKEAADAAAAAAVIDKINDIGAVTYTDECKARIEEARRTYDALTGDQQALVTNDEGLTAAEREYAALKTAADEEEASAVSNKINDIGAVAYTDECKALIDEAKRAYDALTSDQQALVTNYAVLTTAESNYAALKAAADQAAADKAAADKAAADKAAADKAAAEQAAADKNETQDTAAAEPETPAKAESIKSVIVTSAKAGSKKVTLKWNEVKGATSYTVYYSVCNGKAYKKKATVTGTQYVVKNLNNKKEYKFYIKANGADNTLSSTTCHVAMPKNKRTNPKSIKLNFKSAALKAGKTKTIKATVKKEKSGKKLLGHVAKVRYYSSDTAVAKVSEKGVITAVSKGTAVIYAVAENGLSQTVNVTVK